MRIVITKGQTLERALKQLKRKMATEGISKEIRKHNYYEKPSERRRRKSKERIRALRKAQREQAQA
ncbi:MAG: 30S ribosomal protein S21 [Planctomycetota bacterium]